MLATARKNYLLDLRETFATDVVTYIFIHQVMVALRKKTYVLKYTINKYESRNKQHAVGL